MHVYVIFIVVEDASIWCICLYLAFGVLYSWQDDNSNILSISPRFQLLGKHLMEMNLQLKTSFCTSIPASERLEINLACCLCFHLSCEHTHTSSTCPLFLSLLFSSKARDVLFIRLVPSGARLVAILKTRLAKKRMESAGFELGPPASWAI